MKTYQAYLSARTRRHIQRDVEQLSNRVEYIDGTVVNIYMMLEGHADYSEFPYSWAIRLINLYRFGVGSITTYPFDTYCNLCGELSTCKRCRPPRGGTVTSVCSSCVDYVRDCANSVADRTIVCRYTKYLPFVIIPHTPYIIVTFVSAPAISWCNTVGRGCGVLANTYRKALLLHTWMYMHILDSLPAELKYLIINLTLHDNDLGVDQAALCHMYTEC